MSFITTKNTEVVRVFHVIRNDSTKETQHTYTCDTCTIGRKYLMPYLSYGYI